VKPDEAFEHVWADEAAQAEMLRQQKQAWEELKEKDERFVEHVRTRWEPSDKTKYGLEKRTAVRDPNEVTSLAGL